MLGRITRRGMCLVETVTPNLLLDLFFDVSLRHISRDAMLVIK